MAILGGVFLGVVSNFKGKTWVGHIIKNWKSNISLKYPGWLSFPASFIGVFIGLFGPFLFYLLIFPSDYPLFTMFDPVYGLICLVISGTVGKIVGWFL